MELHRRVFGALSPLLLVGIFVVGFVASTDVSRGADTPSDTTVIFASGFSNLHGWKPDHARARVVRSGDPAALVRANRAYGVFALDLRPGPPAETFAGDEYTASSKLKTRRAKRLICLYLREQDNGHTVGRAAGCGVVGRRWTTLSTSSYAALADGNRFVLDIFTVAQGGTTARRSFLVSSAKITRKCKSVRTAAACGGSSGGTTTGTTSGGGTTTDPGTTSGTTSVATTTETVTQPPPSTTAPLSTIEGGAIDAPAAPGVWVGGTYYTEDIDADGGITTWEANHMGTKHMKIRQRYAALLNSDGSLKAPLNVANQCSTGQIPEVTIYPAPGGSAAEAGVLQRIIDGQYDAHIASLARSYGSQACDVLIRLMPEMNGDWNSEWYTGGALNGAQYRQAFQHVVDIFNQEGTQDDVSFVFAPSMGQGNWGAYYPGDAADWLGADNYNMGSCKGENRWSYFGKGPDSMLHWDKSSPSDGKGWYDWAAPLGKPLMISETGSAETAYATDSDPPSKAAYVTQMLADFKAHPAIRAWVHEEYSNGNCNWQADSSPAVQQAFLNLWTDPYLIGR